jgi:hypothetical protein
MSILQTDVRNHEVLFLKQRNENCYPNCLIPVVVSANVIVKEIKSKSIGMEEVSYQLKINKYL